MNESGSFPCCPEGELPLQGVTVAPLVPVATDYDVGRHLLMPASSTLNLAPKENLWRFRNLVHSMHIESVADECPQQVDIGSRPSEACK